MLVALTAVLAAFTVVGPNEVLVAQRDVPAAHRVLRVADMGAGPGISHDYYYTLADADLTVEENVPTEIQSADSAPSSKTVRQYNPTVFRSRFLGQIPIGIWKTRSVRLTYPASRIMSASFPPLAAWKSTPRLLRPLLMRSQYCATGWPGGMDPSMETG